MEQRKKHWWLTIGFIAVVGIFIGILVKGLSIDTSKVPSVQENRPARDFTVELFQGNGVLKVGEKVSLAQFAGKPFILNFWASWCVSCREEARLVEQAWRDFGKDVGFLGIAIQDKVENAQAFAKSFGKTYALALDISGQIALDYGVTGVPETFFVDAMGIIVHREAGPVDRRMIEKYAKK